MNHSLRTFLGIQPQLGKRVYIDPQSTVIGDVHLGNDVSVWPMAVIRADVNYIRIGDLCNIQDGAILHVTHDGPFTSGGNPLILGKGITVGHKAMLHGCIIDEFSLIGMGAIVLDQVHIKKYVIIGAGSVVSPGKILESETLYLGNPARAIRKLSPKEIEHLEYSAQHYVKLKNQYLG